MKINFKIIVIVLSILFLGCNNEQTKTEYYPNGNIMSLKNYKNGKLNGTAEYFLENGNPQSLFTYKNGELEGKSISFYPNGNEKEIYYYKEGKKDGEAKIYYENGNLARLEHYKNDSLHGGFNSFYNDSKLKIQGYYNMGKFDSVWTYFDNYGREIGKGKFKLGSGVQRAWYVKNQLKREIQYKNNLKHGLDIKYDKNGDTIEAFVYENDKFLKKKVIKSYK